MIPFAVWMRFVLTWWWRTRSAESKSFLAILVGSQAIERNPRNRS